jgi:flagellin
MRRVSAVGVDARVSMGSLSLGTQIDPTTMQYTDIRTAVADDDSLSTSNSAFSAIAKAAAINDAYEFTGVKAIVGKTTVGSVNGGTVAGGHNVTDTIGGGDLTETDFFVLNGMKIAGFEVLENDSDNALVDAINAVIDETGVLASLDGNSNLVLTAEDGRNIEITLSSATVATVTGITGLTQNGGLTDVFGGEITLQSNKQIDVVFGGSTNQALGNLRLDGVAGAGTAIFGVSSDFSVETLDISTRESSNLAIEIVDLALEQISAQRASLGAIQNRLESTINNLTTNSENLSASRSRILDADFAAETANLSRNQIIQQAGVSILAQANQQPQIALSLLGQ